MRVVSGTDGPASVWGVHALERHTAQQARDWVVMLPRRSPQGRLGASFVWA